MKVPFLNLHHQNDSVKSELEMAFRQVLESNSFVLGDNVKTFEKRYATFNQTKEAIGVSSGLDALILSLRALEIGAGDEVIVPSNTFIATAIAVSHVGASPVFVEPKKDTYNVIQVYLDRQTRQLQRHRNMNISAWCLLKARGALHSDPHVIHTRQ